MGNKKYINGNKTLPPPVGELLSDDLEGIEKARFWATQAREPERGCERKVEFSNGGS